MTEQRLKEKMELDLLYWHEVDRNQEYSDIRARVDRILALIKVALPELAKEAGYVKLAKDQSLPSNPYGAPTNQEVYQRAIVDFREAGWRKVILEEAKFTR